MGIGGKINRPRTVTGGAWGGRESGGAQEGLEEGPGGRESPGGGGVPFLTGGPGNWDCAV